MTNKINNNEIIQENLNKTIKEQKSKISILNDTINDLINKNNILAKENENILLKNKKTESEINNMQQASSKIEMILASVDKDEASKKEKKEIVHKRISMELTKEIFDLNEKLYKTIEEKKDSVFELEKLKEKYMEKEQLYKNTIEELRKDYDLCQEKLERSYRQLSSDQQLLDKNKNAELTEYLSNLREDRQQLREELETSTKKIEELTQKNDDLLKEIQTLNENYEKVLKEKEVIDKEVNKLKEEMDEKEQTINSLNIKNKKNKENFEKEIIDLTKEKNDSIQKATKEVEYVLKQLKETKEQFGKRVNQLEKSNESMRKEYESEIESLNQQVLPLASQQQTEQAKNLLELSTLLDEAEKAKSIAESNAENRRKLLEKVIIERDQLMLDLDDEKKISQKIKEEIKRNEEKIALLEFENRNQNKGMGRGSDKNNNRNDEDKENNGCKNCMKLKQEIIDLRDELEEFQILKTIDVQEIDNALKESKRNIEKEKEKTKEFEQGYGVIWKSYINLENECNKLLDKIDSKFNKENRSNKEKPENRIRNETDSKKILNEDIQQNELIYKQNDFMNKSEPREEGNLMTSDEISESCFEDVFDPPSHSKDNNNQYDSINDYTYDFTYDSESEINNLSVIDENPLSVNILKNKDQIPSTTYSGSRMNNVMEDNNNRMNSMKRNQKDNESPQLKIAKRNDSLLKNQSQNKKETRNSYPLSGNFSSLDSIIPNQPYTMPANNQNQNNEYLSEIENRNNRTYHSTMSESSNNTTLYSSINNNIDIRNSLPNTSSTNYHKSYGNPNTLPRTKFYPSPVKNTKPINSNSNKTVNLNLNNKNKYYNKNISSYLDNNNNNNNDINQNDKTLYEQNEDNENINYLS